MTDNVRLYCPALDGSFVKITMLPFCSVTNGTGCPVAVLTMLYSRTRLHPAGLFMTCGIIMLNGVAVGVMLYVIEVDDGV